MNEATYYNTASAEEMDSLLDLALSANVEDLSYALDDTSVEDSEGRNLF